MKQKCMTMLMALVLLVGLLAGCGSNEADQSSDDGVQGTMEANSYAETSDEEIYHAIFTLMVPSEQPDIDKIQDAINEITIPAINVEVELLPVTWSGYYSQIPMMLAANEQIDILPALQSSIATYVGSEYIMDLKELLVDNAPYITQLYSEDDLLACSYNGFYYGIPNTSEYCFPIGYIMRTDCLEKVGIDVDTIKTLDDMTEVFEKVQAAYPDMLMLADSAAANIITRSQNGSFGDLMGTAYVVLEGTAQEPVVKNLYETDMLRTACEHQRLWYEAGYIAKDAATVQDTNETLMKAGNTFAFSCTIKPGVEAEKNAQVGYDTTSVKLYDDVVTSGSTNGLVYCVGSGSKRPDKAVQLLDLIISSHELCDLLNWGIEGEHWELQEDGTIDYPEGVTAENCGYHNSMGFAYPNQFNSYVWKGTDPDIFNQYMEVRDAAYVSIAYGFTADVTDYMDSIAVMDSLIAEYRPQIGTGSVDVESTLNELNEKLYEAGMQELIDGVQQQLDEWLAAK